LAQRYDEPLARAVIRSVSDVDSSSTLGSGTPYWYRIGVDRRVRPNPRIAVPCW
jgi:hypothetical protein